MLVFIVGISTALGQTSNGTIVGAVTDASGAAVVGATVTVVSAETGAVRTGVTTSDGTYRIESLLAGTYKVTASAAGFKDKITDGLVVPSSSIVSASIQLEVGSAADKVEVTADNASINIDNGQISGTIGTLEISSLPIASLNPYELALTLPGVLNVTQAGFSNGVNFNVGGGRPRANNFLIEGQDNNDAGIQGQGLQPGNDEAVKEVTIIENAYTAEYGHGAGSVSNLVYKSGSNAFHGSVYERLNNSSLDSWDKADKRDGVEEETKYRENLPGFSIGGPIKRNKAFFFASYQWDYYRSSANLNLLAIPTTAGIATLQGLNNPRVNTLIGAYHGLVGDPSKGPALAPIELGPDPITGLDRGSVAMGYAQRNLGADDDAPELDIKGDYIFSEKDTLNLRFIRTRFTAPYDVFNFPGQLPGFDTDQDGTSYNAGIVETHVFNPKIINEFRLSYGRIGFSFGLPASTTSNPLYNQPAVNITGLQGYGIPAGSIPQGRFHDTYQLQDSVSWTHGKHFIKIGTDIADIRVADQIPFNFYGSISYGKDTAATATPLGPTIYTGLANYIDDFGGAGSVTQNFGSNIARPRLFSQNYFAQDTYRPTPNLSLDLGFRYEYNGAPFNADGTPYPGIDLNDIACFPSAGVTCNTKQQADGSQWGPRAGVVYSPQLLGQHKTVFRSGFGVFYDVVFTNIIDNIQATAPNAAAPVINSTSTASHSRGTADFSGQFPNLNTHPLPGNTAEPIADHLLSPRTMHWNFNIEQELPWSTTFQVGYVGERGTHLYANENLNPYVNQYYYGAVREIPTRGAIIVRDNSGDSNYTGLWSEIDHRFNHDFLFRASYTLGKAMDNVSEIFTTFNQSSYPSSRYGTNRGTTDYGPSAYNHNQRLVLTYIWQPRVWHTEGGMKFVGNIVNHWALAGITQFQTGSPENVEVGTDVDGDGISNDRPIIGNAKAPVNTYAFDNSWFGIGDGGLCSGPSGWNTNDDCHPVSASDVHWIVPYIGGNRPSATVSRNTFYSNGYQQWDMNIQRSFQLHEGWFLDFRGEMFNIFNHGLPGIENTTLTTAIVSDQFNDLGTNTFGDTNYTTTGHRHSRIFVRIRF
jgi:Carboxypeptidase regulatory-like domain/TonB dependent receptor